MIAPRLVLTVAHNFYNRRTNQRYINHKFYPGINGKISSYHKPEGYSFDGPYYYPEEYEKLQEPKQFPYDYAVVRLEADYPCSEHLKLEVNYELSGEMLSIFGYNSSTIKIYFGTIEIAEA